jgi:hypothetical protein
MTETLKRHSALEDGLPVATLQGKGSNPKGVTAEQAQGTVRIAMRLPPVLPTTKQHRGVAAFTS